MTRRSPASVCFCASISMCRWRTGNCRCDADRAHSARRSSGNRRQRRQGHPPFAFRAAEGPEAKIRCARSVAALAAPLEQADNLRRRLHRRERAPGGRRNGATATSLLARKHPLPRRRGGNDPAFVAELAKLGDIYVNDAFSVAHRAHASTEGLAHRLPAYAGRSHAGRARALEQADGDPQRPLIAIVGGAKVSTKLDLLGNLMRRSIFSSSAAPWPTPSCPRRARRSASSLCEMESRRCRAPDHRGGACRAKCEIVLPVDVGRRAEIRGACPSRIVSIDHVGDERHDPRHRAALGGAKSKRCWTSARTLVWNGPFGAFEIEPFDAGTKAVARVAADLTDPASWFRSPAAAIPIAALNQSGAREEFHLYFDGRGRFSRMARRQALAGRRGLAPALNARSEPKRRLICNTRK